MNTGFKRIALVVAAALVAALAAPTAGVAAECDATATVAAASPTATDLVELEPNAARPTFDIALKDKESAVDEELRLARKDRTRLEDVNAVGVELVDPPRAGTAKLEGSIRVSARVNQSKTRVIAFACVTGTSRWDAGRYEGSVLFYGPRLRDFNYAFVITTKWPWWSAILTLVASLVVFFLVAVATRSLVYQAGTAHRIIGTILGAAFAITAVAPVYWTSYVNNPTWGSDPGQQLLALGAAGLTAATAGFAAAHRLLGGTQPGGGG